MCILRMRVARTQYLRFFSKKNLTKNAPISTIFEIRHRGMAHFKALLILLKKGRVHFFVGRTVFSQIAAEKNNLKKSIYA